MDEQHSLSAGYETSDASIRLVTLILGGLAVSIALMLVLFSGVFHYLAAHPSTKPQTNPMADTAGPQLPSPPRIEEHPAIEIKELHAQEDAILSTYGWTNKKAGIVRIPIDRAMDLQLMRGFPAREERAK